MRGTYVDDILARYFLDALLNKYCELNVKGKNVSYKLRRKRDTEILVIAILFLA